MAATTVGGAGGRAAEDAAPDGASEDVTETERGRLPTSAWANVEAASALRRRMGVGGIGTADAVASTSASEVPSVTSTGAPEGARFLLSSLDVKLKSRDLARLLDGGAVAIVGTDGGLGVLDLSLVLEGAITRGGCRAVSRHIAHCMVGRSPLTGNYPYSMRPFGVGGSVPAQALPRSRPWPMGPRLEVRLAVLPRPITWPIGFSGELPGEGPFETPA